MSNYYDPPEHNIPTCPVCGDDKYEYIYKNDNGEILGCDCCITMIEAVDWWDELALEAEPDPDALYEMMRDLQSEER